MAERGMERESRVMSNEDLNAGFKKQRMFLIGVSLALTGILIAGLKFKKVSVLGNEADIDKPEFVYTFLWLVWVWALYRYTVWFKDVVAGKEMNDAQWVDWP